MIYENKAGAHKSSDECGTPDDWTSEWRARLKEKYEEDLAKNHTKRALTSVHRFLELLVVCDKEFLNFHRGTDYQNYVLTIINMVRYNYKRFV